MTIPDPDPRRTPGIEPGGGVSPGETPPAEGGTHGISHPEPPELRKGWGPMPLALIMVVVALVAIGLIAMAVALIA
ncbi:MULTISPECIES: DUF6480 family protein [Streptomyces]|uniref:Uncharacterized protein n=1 Tax=Streptomyces cyaneochromogenes TaxID=2496836 RepID=A0A3Q9EL78_9ACTN|nr:MULTISPECIES: DUF6480 family protein [Streptomyces]AZQ32695.1 hypothetical protein EJ357_03920 [Streptomyces cyaneochromogenes]MCL8010149.1 DUF6480 family protein [Streptomyces sp. AS02]